MWTSGFHNLLVHITSTSKSLAKDLQCLHIYFFSCHILLVDLDYIRQRLKESLIDRCRNYMSTDWLPQDDAKTIPVQGFYTEPCWNKTVKKGLNDQEVFMKGGLYEIFKDEKQKTKRILAEGVNLIDL